MDYNYNNILKNTTLNIQDSSFVSGDVSSASQVLGRNSLGQLMFLGDGIDPKSQHIFLQAKGSAPKVRT